MQAGELWSNAWDVFRRAPSRGGRGRQAAVDFMVYFDWGGFLREVFFRFFFAFERTRPAASMRLLVSFTSLLVLGSSLDSKMARTYFFVHVDSRRAVLWGVQFIYRPRWHTGDVKLGRLILFLGPHVELSNFDPPDRAGESDTVPYPKRHTICYTKRNTRDCREPFLPCYIKPNTGDDKEPPPLLVQPTTGDLSPPVI